MGSGIRVRHQFRVDLSPELSDQFYRVITKLGIDRRIFTRHAFTLYMQALEAMARGENIALVDKNQKVLHQIILV